MGRRKLYKQRPVYLGRGEYIEIRKERITQEALSAAQVYSGQELCTVTKREHSSFNIILSLAVLPSVSSPRNRKLSYVYVCTGCGQCIPSRSSNVFSVEK